MTMTITKTMATLKQAVADADLDGDRTLTTRELGDAVKDGLVTKAQRDVLTIIGDRARPSSGALQTSEYGLWLGRYAEAAVKAGKRNGKLEPGEASSAPPTFSTADGTLLRAVPAVLTKLAAVSAGFDESVAATKLAALYLSPSFGRAATRLREPPSVSGLKRFIAPMVTGRGYDEVTSAVGYIDPAKKRVFFNVDGITNYSWPGIPSSPFSRWYSVPFAKVQ
jgi:hypothetical protein